MALCHPHRATFTAPRPRALAEPRIFVEATQQHIVPLQDVLGHNVLPTLQEVMEEQYDQLGWTRESRHVYVRELGTRGVTLRLNVAGPHPVAELQVSEQVRQSLRRQTETQLAEAIRQINPLYHRALAEVLHLCYTRVLVKVVPTLGKVIWQTPEAQTTTETTRETRIQIRLEPAGL